MTATGESARPASGTDPREADGLIEAVRAIGSELEASSLEAEELRTLPPGIVQRFRDLGLFWLKTPEDLGGRPLHPLAFADLVETIAYYDASAAWATVIGCGSTGLAAGWLPDAGIDRVFSSRSDMPVVAGQPRPRGTAVPAPGGYVVTGRWSFASGIHHSNWVLGAAKVEGLPEESPGSEIVFVAEKDSATVYDNWHVAGLQGSGSSDFSLEGVFIPEDLTHDRRSGRRSRGGPLFRQEGILFVGNEVPAVCVGIATRAIDDMVAMADQSRRIGGASLGERPVFHKELGQAKTKVAAARLFYRDAIGSAFDAACAGLAVPDDIQRAAAVAQPFVAETCFDVVADLFRYGGGRVLALSNPMQRHLRNLLAARQHIAATEEHYEMSGRALVLASTETGA